MVILSRSLPAFISALQNILWLYTINAVSLPPLLICRNVAPHWMDMRPAITLIGVRHGRVRPFSIVSNAIDHDKYFSLLIFRNLPKGESKNIFSEQLNSFNV